MFSSRSAFTEAEARFEFCEFIGVEHLYQIAIERSAGSALDTA